MTTRKFLITAEIEVTVEIDDDVFDAVTDEWREVFYDLDSEEEIVEHIAYNLLINNIELSNMDGWADQPNSNARAINDLEWYAFNAREIK